MQMSEMGCRVASIGLTLVVVQLANAASSTTNTCVGLGAV